jgi:hypothetical protein
MNPQHGGQGIQRAATLLAVPGVAGSDQVDQRLPGHHLIHLIEVLLAPGALLGRGLLLIAVDKALREAVTKLLSAHEPCGGLWLHKTIASHVRWVLQSLPRCLLAIAPQTSRIGAQH